MHESSRQTFFKSALERHHHSLGTTGAASRSAEQRDCEGSNCVGTIRMSERKSAEESALTSIEPGEEKPPALVAAMVNGM